MGYGNFFEDVMIILQRIENKVDRADMKKLVIPEVSDDPSDDRVGCKYIMTKYHRSYSWVTQRTMASCSDPLPNQKFGRDLIFSKKKVDEYMEARMITKVGDSESISRHLQDVAKDR